MSSATKVLAKPRTISRRRSQPGEDTAAADAMHYNKDDNVWVIAQGKWYQAKIAEVSTHPHPEKADQLVPSFRVHYPGWNVRYDEWVMAEAMMPTTPESAEIAAKENGAAPPDDRSNRFTGRKRKQSVVAPAEDEGVAEPGPSTPKARRSAKKPGKTARLEQRDTAPAATEGHSSSPESAPEVSVPDSPEKAISSEGATSSDSGPSAAVVPESVAPSRRATEEQYMRKRDAYNNPSLVADEVRHLGQQLLTAQDKTEEERKDLREILQKLEEFSIGNHMRLKDNAVAKVNLPLALKRALALSYYLVVRCGKLLSKPAEEFSAGRILERYQEYCTANPVQGRTENWHKARLAEVQSFVDNFDTLLPRCLFRHELPHYEELLKKEVDLKSEYGFHVVAKMILLMVQNFNMDGKRIIVKRIADNLMAIYQDFLEFIETKIMPEQPENSDDLYRDMNQAYRRKIPYIAFLKTSEDQCTLSQFHHLSDDFFKQLLETEMADENDYALKVVWKQDASSDDAEPHPA